jgi:CheY-like chemotaxis protein
MKSRLLIVDDKPDNLVVLSSLLGEQYELIKANSGEEALGRLRSTAPVDLILLDIEMPGLDGYETTRIIKRTPELRQIPVILISGFFTEDPFVRKGYESGAVDYFVKPFDADALKVKVGVYASLGQKDAELKEKDARIRDLEERLKELGQART